MRPIFSPSEFIQMKGRGTRIFDFKTLFISKKDIDTKINSQKDNFYLFDFFGNCQYFEDEFNYDAVIKLPSNSESDSWDITQKKIKLDLAENLGLDPIHSIKQIDIGEHGMKIDRVYFNSFEVTVKNDGTLEELVKQKEFDKAEEYLQKNVFDRPDKFFSLELLKKSLNLDRNISTKELLLYVYGYINKIKLRDECEEEEFERFDNLFKINEDNFDDIKKFFYTYLNDNEFRNIVDSKEFAKLSTHPMNDVVPRIPNDMLSRIPTYIKNHNILYKFT
jgi:type I restriction enzyme R subunit